MTNAKYSVKIYRVQWGHKNTRAWESPQTAMEKNIDIKDFVGELIVYECYFFVIMPPE